MDITQSLEHMPGVSAALDVINGSTPHCLPRTVTQRRLNMSTAIVNNSSVSITDNSTIIHDHPAEEKGSDNSDSDSSSDSE